jgi:pyruvoyl-dependent arginine decarboxylase (PvlArgDC)
MRYTDLMEISGDTARKAEIRKRIASVILNALNNECEQEYVRYITEDIYVGESASKIPGNTIIADVGDVTNKDKMLIGALVEVTIKVKNWNDTRTAKTDRPAFTLDDIDEALQIMEEKRKKKEEEEKRKKEAKLKKIEKDTKNREKAK